MENKMFCYQCQEASNNVACTTFGVCGKSNELSYKMDLFKHSLKLLAQTIINSNREAVAYVEEELFIIEGLFKLITNANFNEDVFDKCLIESYKMVNNISGITVDISNIKDSYQNIGPLQEDNIDLRGVKELIITGIMGIAAYVSHAHRLGFSDRSINYFILDTLAKIDNIKDLDTLIKLVDETGQYGVTAMALLDNANTSKFGNPQLSEVNIGTKKRPGILISGHDLADMEELLIQTKDTGIDIYTHCEMLPAHYYPTFKKYDHLVGNYGGSWWQQRSEFTSFNGPIIFTTNCIVPPLDNATYRDRVYTTGNAGSSAFKHIDEVNGRKDFSCVIEQAKQCLAPEEIESGTITGGFAHAQVFELAETVVANIKNGSIRKFVVMAGCDGRNTSRNYYEEFATKLPKDTIILTAGCAKYRYNKLNLGDINGIPRVLDAGQCNDSYSLVVIALKLKELFELDNINDLPISYNIAWYEQKAVIVLLALLHLGVQNIKLGPTLPAFITEDVAAFLIDTYNISTISSVNEDLQTIG